MSRAADPKRDQSSSSSHSPDEFTGPEKRLPYDRQFHPAVSEGLLTVQQAIARGNRRAWAERLVQRHGLSLEKALQVADNRVTLKEVIAGSAPAGPTFSVHPAPRRRSWPVLGLLAIAALALGAAVALDLGRTRVSRARGLVDDFERGKPPATIDYGHPVYQRALGELRRVPSFSIHAQEAESMRQKLETKIGRQQEQVAVHAAERRRVDTARQARRAAFLTAARRERLIPEDHRSHPECD